MDTQLTVQGLGVFGFAQRKGTGSEGHTRWMLVAGEGPNEGAAARPAAARKPESEVDGQWEVNGRAGEVGLLDHRLLAGDRPAHVGPAGKQRA